MPFLLALLSGVLLAFSLPPHDFSFLAWFALVPLLMAVRTLRPLEAAGSGLMVGLVAGTIHARFAGGLFLVFAYAPFLWFGLLCAIFAVAANRLRDENNALRRVSTLACISVVAEWVTFWTPLPINFAVTQHRVLDLIQIADITGIWGVSFLLWFANAAIAGAILQRRSLKLKAQIVPLSVAASLVLASFVYSRFRLGEAQATTTLRVAAIQAFEPNGMDSFADAVASDALVRESLTKKAISQGARLVIWSEEVLGTDFEPDKNDDATRQLARTSQTYLVAGYIDQSAERQFNSAALLSPRGQIIGSHRKIHLYAGERSTTKAGTTPTVVASSLGKIGVAICFDTCWTNVVRDETKSGAQIIAMPNFDPPVPRGVVHYLHGAMLPFRAVENRVPIVRADPNGQSGTIDSQGRVLESLPLWKAGASVSDVRLGDGTSTFFTQSGDWLAWLCVAFAVIGVGLRRGAPKVRSS